MLLFLFQFSVSFVHLLILLILLTPIQGKALKNSGLSATTDTRRDMSARSLRKKSEIATKLNPNTVTENASDTKQTPQTKLSVEEAKEKSVSEGEKLRRKRRKEKQKERKRQLKLQAEAEAAAAASAPCSSAPGNILLFSFLYSELFWIHYQLLLIS